MTPVSKTELERYTASEFDFSDAIAAIQMKAKEQRDLINAVVADLVNISKDERKNIDEQNFEFLKKYFANLEEQLEFYSLYSGNLDSQVNSSAITDASFKNLPSANVFNDLKSLRNDVDNVLAEMFEKHRLALQKKLALGKSIDTNKKFETHEPKKSEVLENKPEVQAVQVAQSSDSIQESIDEKMKNAVENFKTDIQSFVDDLHKQNEERLKEARTQFEKEKELFLQFLYEHQTESDSKDESNKSAESAGENPSTTPSSMFGLFSSPSKPSINPATSARDSISNLRNRPRPSEVASENVAKMKPVLGGFKELYDKEVKKRLDVYIKLTKGTISKTANGKNPILAFIKFHVNLLFPLALVAFPLKILGGIVKSLFVVGKFVAKVVFKAVSIIAKISFAVINTLIIKPLKAVWKKLGGTAFWQLTKKMLFSFFKTPVGAYVLGYMIGFAYGTIKREIKTIKESVRNFGESMKNRTIDFLTKMKNRFEETKLGKWLIPKVEKIIHPLVRDVKMLGMVEWLKEHISKDYIVNKVGDIFGWIVNTLSAVYETFKEKLIKDQAAAIGGAAGTAIGMAIGSIIPGAGTALGGMIGGLIGSFSGPYIYDTWRKINGTYYKPINTDAEDALYAYATTKEGETRRKQIEEMRGTKKTMIEKNTSTLGLEALESMNAAKKSGEELGEYESQEHEMLIKLQSMGAFSSAGMGAEAIANTLLNEIRFSAPGEKKLAKDWQASVHGEGQFKNTNGSEYRAEMEKGVRQPDLPLEIDAKTGKFIPGNVPMATDEFNDPNIQNYFGGRRLINPYAYRVIHAIIAEQLASFYEAGKINAQQFVSYYNQIKKPSHRLWMQVISNHAAGAGGGMASHATGAALVVSQKIVDSGSFEHIHSDGTNNTSNFWLRPSSEQFGEYEKMFDLAHDHRRGVERDGFAKIHMQNSWNSSEISGIDEDGGTFIQEFLNRNDMKPIYSVGVDEFQVADEAAKNALDSIISRMMDAAGKLDLKIVNPKEYADTMSKIILTWAAGKGQLKPGDKVSSDLLNSFADGFIFNDEKYKTLGMHIIALRVLKPEEQSKIFNGESVNGFVNKVASLKDPPIDDPNWSPFEGIESRTETQLPSSMESPPTMDQSDPLSNPGIAAVADSAETAQAPDVSGLIAGEEENYAAAQKVIDGVQGIQTQQSGSLVIAGGKSGPSPQGLAGKDSGEYTSEYS